MTTVAPKVIRRHQCQRCGLLYVCDPCTTSTSRAVIPVAYGKKKIKARNATLYCHQHVQGAFFCERCK